MSSPRKRGTTTRRPSAGASTFPAVDPRLLLRPAAELVSDLAEAALDALAGDPTPATPDLIGTLSNAELEALELEEAAG